MACFLSGIRQRPDSRVIEGLPHLACFLEPALDHRAHLLQGRIEALPRLINGGFKLETSSGWFPLRKTGAAKCQLQQSVDEGIAVKIWAGAQQQRDGTADRLGQITRLTVQDRSRETHGAVLPRALRFLGRPFVLNVQPRHAFLECWKHGNPALLQRQSLNLRQLIELKAVPTAEQSVCGTRLAFQLCPGRRRTFAAQAFKVRAARDFPVVLDDG